MSTKDDHNLNIRLPNPDDYREVDQTTLRKLPLTLRLLELGTGVTNLTIESDDAVTLDLATLHGYRRLMEVLFDGPLEEEDAEAYASIFGEWEVELLPYLRQQHPEFAADAARAGCAAEAIDAIVTVRMPVRLFPWLVRRLFEVPRGATRTAT